MDLFLFHISLDSARIRRYFRLNLLVPRRSIRRKVYFQVTRQEIFPISFFFFDSRTQEDQFRFLSNLYLYKIYIDINQIMASCIKYFHIEAYDFFVLFRQCEESECEKETFIYSLLLFNLILY